MGLKSRLQSFFFSTEEPSVKEEFVQIVQARAEQLGVSPEKVLASLGEEGSLQASADAADAAVASCFPDSPCLNADELYEAALTEGQELPPDRQSHLKQCAVCELTLRLASPNEERVIAMSRRLAEPPPHAEIRDDGRPEGFDRIAQRDIRRESQLGSLRAGVTLRQKHLTASPPESENRRSVSAGTPFWRRQLLSPGGATAFAMVLVVVLCYPKVFIDSQALKEKVHDLRADSQTVKKAIHDLPPVELVGQIVPAPEAVSGQTAKFVMHVKGDQGNRLVILNPGNESAAFDPVRLAGRKEGKVTGWITLNKKNQMEISVKSVQFAKQANKK